MSSVNERLASLEAKTEENGKTILRVLEAIYGNGKPGLLTEFQLLRQSVEEHHGSVEELRKKNRGDWRWIITTLVAVSAVIVAYFK